MKTKENQTVFSKIEVKGKFSIPSFSDHKPESFIKWKHNKAKSCYDGRLVHFNDDQTVWDNTNIWSD